MKTFLMAGAALLVVAPASAQILGGGGLGGAVGGLGGGLGGSVGGTLGSTVERGRASTDTTSRAASRVRADRLRSQPRVSTDGDLGVANTTRLGERSVAVDRSAAYSTSVSASDLGRTRGATAAAARGLTRVEATAAGVPVYVAPANAAVSTATAVTTRGYPAYGGAYYYAPGAVYVEDRYVDSYMDRQQRDLGGRLQGTGARVERRGDDLVVLLPADVTFAFDKADIRPRFYGALDAFAATMHDYPGTDIEVVGHTDSVGSDGYNLALSERRGRSVADFLVHASVAPYRLVVEAMGEAEPIASNASVDGRAANRRVELIVHPRAG